MVKHIFLFVTFLVLVYTSIHCGMVSCIDFKPYSLVLPAHYEVLIREDTVDWFNKTIPFVLKHEGDAYVADTSINEVSRRGITLTTYRQYYGLGDSSSIKNITVRQATAIYKHSFWDANNLDSLVSMGFKKTAIVLMDSEVNLGSSRANKFFQKIIGIPEYKRTGRIDEYTLKVLSSKQMSDDVIYKRLVVVRRYYYDRLVRRNNVFKRYHNGWNNRLDAILVYAKEM